MAFLEWLIHETSLHSLISAGSRDTYLLLLSRFLRMFAYGGAALVLASFLWSSGHTGTSIGSFLTIALLGDAAISYLFTIKADKIGRRRVLLIGSMLMICSGTTFALTKNYYILLVAAIVGVITPGAHEVGPFRAVQESTLAQLTKVEARTDVYAWFAVTSTVGMASGLFFAGLLIRFQNKTLGYEWKDCIPAVFGVYAIIGLIKVCIVLCMTERCEANYSPPPRTVSEEEQDTSSRPLLSERDRQRSYGKDTGITSRVRRIGSSVTAKVSRENRGTLIKLGFLFAINSFAAGMLPVTIMSWYVSYWFRRFVLYRVGYAMAAVWLLASLGVLFSASVARRLGLIRTMVLMHLPNAIFLAFIPLAPNWWVTMILLFISAALGSMDQAPRMAFIAAVFQPEERTAVMGTINLIRTVAAAGGPLVSGYLWEKKKWWLTFVIAAILKISYDIGLLVMFINTKLPEQRGATVADVDVGILLSENLTHPAEFSIFDQDDLGEEQSSVNSGGYGKVSYDEIRDA